MTRRPAAFILASAVAAAMTAALAGQSSQGAEVDKVFAKWTTSTPGCAVGVGVEGKPALAKAYGMADLEHDVGNTADTIFEGGSLSKQFTAAAVLLLAREGKLSLDDPVRKYVPEVPDYGAPLTIRHMLNHTSGLRDWGSVAAIAGWPRTTRVHTHAHVLEIVNHQRALNFTPGTRYSYSNTGYNLSAIIVSRVSGVSFADFTRTRIFEPLGMTRTSWRDDFTRVVKQRAIAYDDEQGVFHTDMPFENVHGNGGLLTTVGDLLKWNENFTVPKVGNASFVAEQQQPGKFNDGRTHNYALGLMVNTYKGVRQVDHSGSTAGYRAHLSRYPDQQVSVAVLCNVSSGNATQAARAVAELYLGDRAKAPAPPVATYTLTAAELEQRAGLYRDTRTGVPLTISRGVEGLRVERGQSDGLNPAAGQRLIAMSSSRLVTASGQTWELDGRGNARVTDAVGTVDTYERVPAARPTADQLKEFAGRYVSDEAETTLTAVVNGSGLAITRRPDTTLALTPVYADAFTAPQLGLVIFRRDGGRVSGLSVVQDRVWDLRFARQAATPTKTSTSSR
jgi:CubicO group peptidase (beta-lactamase class C family)